MGSSTTSATRGLSGDLVADIVLGKPSFSEIVPNEITERRLNTANGGGAIVDRLHGVAYFWDAGNSRVVVWDEASGSVIRMLGQPSFNSASCNGDSGFQNYPLRAPATASSLCGVPEATLSTTEEYSPIQMAVLPGGELLVPDPGNNRVKKYTSPWVDDTVSFIWGQPDAASNECNMGGAPTNRSLCLHQAGGAGAVDVSATGVVAIADWGNHRVVLDANGDGQWDVALLQPDFTTGGYWAPGPRPGSVRFVGDDLYVVGDGQIFIFAPPFVTGMPATRTWTPVSSAEAIELDPLGRGLWVLASDGLRLFAPDETTVLQGPLYDGGWNGGGVGISASGSAYIVSSGAWDVFRYDYNGTTYGSYVSLFNLWPGAGQSFGNTVGPSGLAGPAGIDFWGDQLIVSSGGRLTAWNGAPASLANGKPFDVVVGEPDAYTIVNNSSCCGAISTSAKGWLAAVEYPGVSFFQLPLSNGAAPIGALNSPLPVLDGGSVDLKTYWLFGVAATPAGSLWISDSHNSRVLRVRDALTAPVVDAILGQVDSGGIQCNRGLYAQASDPPLDFLCSPGALAFDRNGNLFVGDNSPEVEGNFRALIFAAASIPEGNSQTIYAPTAVKAFPYRATQPGIMSKPGFDASNRMVVGFNSYLGGRFLAVYDDPLGPSVDPTRYVADLYSCPSTVAFDSVGNMYASDGCRNRVSVYLAPFSAATPTPTAAPPTLTLTPTRIAATPTPTPTQRVPPGLHKKTPTPHP